MFPTITENKFQYIPNIPIDKKGVGQELKVQQPLFWMVKKEITEEADDFYYMTERLRVSYYKKSIDFIINGYNIKLPYNLNHIADSIIESQYLLELDDDWDEEGANSTNFETYKNAIDFVTDSSKLLDNYTLKVVKPFIDITRDGSISVQWDTPKASFFIIFKKDNKEYAYYYGQEKETSIGFKYRIKLAEKIDQITISWMIQYLT